MDDALDGPLDALAPISLDAMEGVALLDRTDTKYLLPSARLPDLLADLGDAYRVLEVAGQRTAAYETLSFDDESLRCYRRHHAGRAVRTKVRARRYGSTNACFVEVKRRDNHGRTIKRRMAADRLPDALHGAAADFVRHASDLDPASLAATLWTEYRRSTLAGRLAAERVTIDRGLAFRGADAGRFAGLAIVEVKRPRTTAPSAVVRTLARLRVHPGGVSKYCLGMVATRPRLPHNNFLESLRRIDKVLHASR